MLTFIILWLSFSETAIGPTCKRENTRTARKCPNFSMRTFELREARAFHLAGQIEIRIRTGTRCIFHKPDLHVTVHVDCDRARYNLRGAGVNLSRFKQTRAEQHGAARGCKGHQKFSPRRIQ